MRIAYTEEQEALRAELEAYYKELLTDDIRDALHAEQGCGPTNRSVVFHQILEKHKIKHDYYAGGNGAHDWATWRHLLYVKLLPNLWRGKQ